MRLKAIGMIFSGVSILLDIFSPAHTINGSTILPMLFTVEAGMFKKVEQNRVFHGVVVQLEEIGRASCRERVFRAV